MAKVKPKVVLYLCDRKRCGDRCHYPDCRHTTDISHAVHGGAFPDGFEKVMTAAMCSLTMKESAIPITTASWSPSLKLALDICGRGEKT